MSDAVEYPHNVLPRNDLRRVLGNLPAAHPQHVLDANWEYRSGLWMNEPIDPAPYPTSITLAGLVARLDADPASFHGAETQYTGQPTVGATQGPNYTARHVAQCLSDLIDLGYAAENQDGSYSMTTEGHAALCE